MGDFLKVKFIDAAYSNNVEDMDFCFGMGDVDVNCVNDKGSTALLAAVNNGSIAAIDRLLKCDGLDVNKAGKDLRSPLFIACQKGMTSLVKKLLEHPDIDVNTQDKYTTTAFMVALKAGHDDILSMLLKHPGLDINQQKKDGTTALMSACNLGQTKVVKELLRSKDIDITLTDKNGKTAKDIAEKKKSREIITALDDFSRGKQTRSRVFSSNKNFRDYQVTIQRGSFLSNFSEDDFNARLNAKEEKKTSESSKKEPGNVMAKMIRMQSNLDLDNSDSKLDTAELAPTKTILRKKKNKETKKMEEPVPQEIPETTSEKTKEDSVREEKEEPAPQEEVATKFARPEPEFNTDLGVFLMEHDGEDLCKILFENKVKTPYVASKLTDFELTHEIGLSNELRAKLKDIITANPEKTRAPTRKYDCAFISDDSETTDGLMALPEMEKCDLSKENASLETVVSEVENANILGCVISGEDFFKKESNLVALTSAFINKIHIVGVNPKGAESNAVLFKLVLRLGHGLLDESSWEAVKTVDISYPKVYDAIEHLSKNMATSVEDFKTKLKSN